MTQLWCSALRSRNGTSIGTRSFLQNFAMSANDSAPVPVRHGRTAPPLSVSEWSGRASA